MTIFQRSQILGFFAGEIEYKFFKEDLENATSENCDWISYTIDVCIYLHLVIFGVNIAKYTQHGGYRIIGANRGKTWWNQDEMTWNDTFLTGEVHHISLTTKHLECRDKWPHWCWSSHFWGNLCIASRWDKLRDHLKQSLNDQERHVKAPKTNDLGEILRSTKHGKIWKGMDNSLESSTFALSTSKVHQPFNVSVLKP